MNNDGLCFLHANIINNKSKLYICIISINRITRCFVSITPNFLPNMHELALGFFAVGQFAVRNEKKLNLT